MGPAAVGAAGARRRPVTARAARRAGTPPPGRLRHPPRTFVRPAPFTAGVQRVRPRTTCASIRAEHVGDMTCRVLAASSTHALGPVCRLATAAFSVGAGAISFLPPPPTTPALLLAIGARSPPIGDVTCDDTLHRAVTRPPRHRSAPVACAGPPRLRPDFSGLPCDPFRLGRRRRPGFSAGASACVSARADRRGARCVTGSAFHAGHVCRADRAR